MMISGRFGNKMKNVALQNLVDLLERKYGSLEDGRCCYVNGAWLSVPSIVELIERVDEKS